jgi:CBS domain-containing protein
LHARCKKHNVGTVVVEDQKPVGIVTDRDLALALGAQGIRPHASVERVMTRQVVAIPADTSVYTATKSLFRK